MEKYLGETLLNVKDTKFKDYTTSDWTMYYIERYGGIDGGHHKDWVFDQISRIIKGSPIIIKLAKWESGVEEYRINIGEPSQEYLDWVIAMCDGEDGPNTYNYDEGIAP